MFRFWFLVALTCFLILVLAPSTASAQLPHGFAGPHPFPLALGNNIGLRALPPVVVPPGGLQFHGHFGSPRFLGGFPQRHFRAHPHFKFQRHFRPFPGHFHGHSKFRGFFFRSPGLTVIIR